MKSSINELHSLYRIVLSLNQENDKTFGFNGKSREKKFIEAFGSEKEFIENLGVSLKDKEKNNSQEAKE